MQGRQYTKSNMAGYSTGTKIIIVWILLVYLYPLIAETKRKEECPPPELTPSCSCKKHIYITLTCYDLINMWDFIQILHKLKEYDIHELYYSNLNMQFLPKGFLKYIPINILMISRSVILGLETDDGEAMFEGATESIEILNMHSVEGAKSWRWKPLISLKNLKTLGINACDLTRITSDFSLLAKSIEIINFSGNKISDIYDSVFDSYQKLNFLDLAINEISTIKRSMFPNPATNLRTLLLSENEIKELPEDIFTNMPALRNLDLSLNKIKWLSLPVFQPIYVQLYSLNLKDNDIYCCGAQEWMITVPEFRKVVEGKCKSPASLAGKDLRSLVSNDLHHGLC